MKKIVLLSLIWCASGVGFAQGKRHQEFLKHEGDNLYKNEQYSLAIEYYRELVTISDKQPEVLYRLAESYRLTFNYSEAEIYYLKAYYQDPANALSLYYYALMLKLNGSFDESIKSFDEFIALAEYTPHVKEYVDQALIDQAGAEMARTQQGKRIFSLTHPNINSTYNDYAPALRDSTTIAITSGRVASNREAIDERYGEAFTDNLYFVKTNGAWQDKTRQIFSVTNTKYNDGSGCFNTTGDKYYFTFCGKSNANCVIYLTTWKDNKWSDPVALNTNVNLPGAETKHPAISHGGDTLMFSSNRAGGVGGYDIWMSVNSGNDHWGPAINLGARINTKLNELAPAFTIFSHIFFFASDGHQNYGGLDLYMAKRLSNGTVDLYNLDYPFNSNRDDCFVSILGQWVYFSSNRSEGKGGFDIYAVRIPSIVSFTSRLSLKNKGSRTDVNLKGKTESVSNINLLAARNEDRLAYENLTYEKKRLVEQMVTTQGNRESIDKKNFPSLTDQEFNDLKRIAESRYRAQQLEQKFSTSLLSKINTSGHTTEVNITGYVRDSVSHQLLPDQRILLIDQSGEILKTTSTNEAGKFRFTNVPSGTTVFIRFESSEGNKYFAKAEDVKLMSAGTAQPFENIYFDFDHYALRPEAKEVLNSLADLLIKNPSVQVEIYAYADDRGADDYNLRLTQKRGQAVLNYLDKRGVDQTALAVIAKGKHITNTNQSDIQRQLNRRVEFYLNGAEIHSSTGSKTYIIKEKKTWNELASITQVDVNELKRMNGTAGEWISALQPVRLPAVVNVSPDLFYTIR